MFLYLVVLVPYFHGYAVATPLERWCWKAESTAGDKSPQRAEWLARGFVVEQLIVGEIKSTGKEFGPLKIIDYPVFSYQPDPNRLTAFKFIFPPDQEKQIKALVGKPVRLRVHPIAVSGSTADAPRYYCFRAVIEPGPTDN